MDRKSAVRALGSLAQDTRIEIFRLLVQAGPQGLPAGRLAEMLGLAPSSLSFHLGHMTQAGLLTQRRSGRSLIYAPDFGVMNAVIGYLTENCCGLGEVCAPLCDPASIEAKSRSCG